MFEADAHEIAADRWGTVNYGLGLPIVVLSAIASTSALADFDKSNVVAAVLALVVAVLSALATFLNAQKTAELHRTAAASYRTLGFRAQSFGRSLDLLPLESEAVDTVNSLEDERNKLMRESPSLSRRIRSRVEGVAAD